MMNLNELTSNDVKTIINDQNKFFYTGQTLNIDFRINALKTLKDCIKKYETKITEALYNDLGKHEFESYTTEIGYVLSSITYAIKNLKKWSKPKMIKTPLYLFPSKSFIINEPYGTVLIIGPFNYPFQLIIEPLIGAIAAGNTVVLKPSESCPTVSKILCEMISKCFPENYICSLEGTLETNTNLSRGLFDYIFFTGSPEVGKIIMSEAAKNLIPVTLELGGKSPVIVDKNADIKIAAQRIIWGKMINCGQTCVAPDYILVDENIKDELILELAKTIKDFYGDNIKDNRDFGHIINERHFNRLKSLLDLDKDKIILGGLTDKNSLFIEPTLLYPSSYKDASMKEEIFGPILPIIPYSNLDDAIKQIQKFPKPLALYLFSTNKDVQKKILDNISFGGGCINDTITHLANPKMPFGGVSNSGIGSYHGEYSFITFSHKKSILKKSNKFNITLLYPPFTKDKLKIIKRFLH